jgi:phage gpG-like protein
VTFEAADKTGELARYKQALLDMAARVSNPTALYDEAGQMYVNAENPSIFRAGGGLEGHEDWEPLKDPTRGGKNAAGGGRPLNDTGRMRDSVNYVASEDGLHIGTILVAKDGFSYPALHQRGGRFVPRREWLFFTAAFLDRVRARWREMVGL